LSNGNNAHIVEIHAGGPWLINVPQLIHSILFSTCSGFGCAERNCDQAPDSWIIAFIACCHLKPNFNNANFFGVVFYQHAKRITAQSLTPHLLTMKTQSALFAVFSSIGLFLCHAAGAQTTQAWAVDGVRAPTGGANNTGDMSLAYFQNTQIEEHITIGNSGGQTTRRTWNPVFGFALPTLSDSIQSVTLDFTRTSTNNTPFSWQVMLYAFEPDWNPREQSPIDVFHQGGYSGSGNLTVDPPMAAIDDRAWVRHLPNPDNTVTGSVMSSTSHPDGTRISIDLTSFFTGSGALADYYNPDGTPTTDYIWFRLSANASTGGVQRIRVFEGLNDPTDTPTLAFSVIPEPSTYGLLLGAGMLGFILVRRRLNRS
jgi:hypothetical protein